MRSRVNGVFVVMTLMLSALFWSGCSKKSQPTAQAVGKSQSQYSSKAVSKVQSQYSSIDPGKAKSLPSNEVIIKAIDDSGIMKRTDGSLTVIPPVKIVEKGKRNKNGSWPVKVKFTVTYKVKEGQVSPPTATTSLFTIFEEKDNVGKYVWKAKLGS